MSFRVLLVVAVALVVAVVVSARPYAPPIVPAGTPVEVVLQISLDTRQSDAGDRFSARVISPVIVRGQVAVPEGAFLHGHVFMSDPLSRDGGRGRLQLAYDQIEFGGNFYELSSRSRVYVGPPARGVELGAGSSLKFTLDRDVSVRPARSV